MTSRVGWTFSSACPHFRCAGKGSIRREMKQWQAKKQHKCCSASFSEIKLADDTMIGYERLTPLREDGPLCQRSSGAATAVSKPCWFANNCNQFRFMSNRIPYFVFFMSQKTKKSENKPVFHYEANVRQLMYLGTCGLFKELQKHLTSVWTWDLHTTFLKENTKEGRKIRDVPYFLLFFDVSLWDGMNNSTVFIPHRITDVFLPSLLLSSLQSQTSLGFHLSLPQHLFIWLAVYTVAPCLHSQPAHVVHHARQPPELRKGRAIASELV